MNLRSFMELPVVQKEFCATSRTWHSVKFHLLYYKRHYPSLESDTHTTHSSVCLQLQRQSWWPRKASVTNVRSHCCFCDVTQHMLHLSIQYTHIFIYYVNFLRIFCDGALTPVHYRCFNPTKQTKKRSTPYYPSKHFTISKAQTLNRITASRILLYIHLQAYCRFQRHLHCPSEICTYKTEIHVRINAYNQ